MFVKWLITKPLSIQCPKIWDLDIHFRRRVSACVLVFEEKILFFLLFFSIDPEQLTIRNKHDNNHFWRWSKYWGETPVFKFEAWLSSARVWLGFTIGVFFLDSLFEYFYSQLKSYIGYIHQIKYNSGHTYGEQTHLLADKFPKFARSKTMGASTDDLPFELRPRDKYTIKHELPKSLSGNKLSERMVPGYTGYIPSRKFHFSDTYRAECDQCIDDFMTAKENKAAKSTSITRVVRSYDRHNAVAPNGEVKTFLDYYRDSNPNSVSVQCKTSYVFLTRSKIVFMVLIVFKRTKDLLLSPQCPATLVTRRKLCRPN